MAEEKNKRPEASLLYSSGNWRPPGSLNVLPAPLSRPHSATRPWSAARPVSALQATRTLGSKSGHIDEGILFDESTVLHNAYLNSHTVEERALEHETRRHALALPAQTRPQTAKANRQITPTLYTQPSSAPGSPTHFIVNLQHTAIQEEASHGSAGNSARGHALQQGSTAGFIGLDAPNPGVPSPYLSAWISKQGAVASKSKQAGTPACSRPVSAKFGPTSDTIGKPARPSSSSWVRPASGSPSQQHPRPASAPRVVAHQRPYSAVDTWPASQAHSGQDASGRPFSAASRVTFDCSTVLRQSRRIVPPPAVEMPIKNMRRPTSAFSIASKASRTSPAMLQLATMHDSVAEQPVYNEEGSIRTADDVVSYFTLHGHSAQKKLFYLNKNKPATPYDVLSPFDLVVVPHDKIEKEYWTISTMGVVHITEDDNEGEFTDLGEWMRCGP